MRDGNKESEEKGKRVVDFIYSLSFLLFPAPSKSFATDVTFHINLELFCFLSQSIYNYLLTSTPFSIIFYLSPTLSSRINLIYHVFFANFLIWSAWLAFLLSLHHRLCRPAHPPRRLSSLPSPPWLARTTVSPNGAHHSGFQTLVLWRDCKKRLKVLTARSHYSLICSRASATHLTNHFFDGARADLAKSLSMLPLFQVTHSFSLASQTAPPTYNFGAVFATNQVCFQLSHCTLKKLTRVDLATRWCWQWRKR